MREALPRARSAAWTKVHTTGTGSAKRFLDSHQTSFRVRPGALSELQSSTASMPLRMETLVAQATSEKYAATGQGRSYTAVAVFMATALFMATMCLLFGVLLAALLPGLSPVHRYAHGGTAGCALIPTVLSAIALWRLVSLHRLAVDGRIEVVARSKTDRVGERGVPPD